MSSTRVRVIAGLVAAMTMIGSAPAQASADNVVVQPIAMTATEQQAVRNYWTPERIAAIPSTPPSGQPPVDGPDGAGWTSGGDVSKTVGRLFFTERGEDASCTATIVDSANGSAAVTAGHCLHTFNLIRQDPRWSANLFFVPGFRDGEQPYGGFVVRQAVADARWVQDDERDEFDQGLVVLNPGVDGRSAIDTVGASQRIGFDVAGGQEVREFGYPRSAKQPGHQGRPEFTGRRLAQCWGPALERTGTAARPVPRGLWGITCDMGGGSSGGPRLAGFDTYTGAGTVVGVDTQGYSVAADGQECEPGASGCARHPGGPQLTAAITGPLYERAQSV